MDIAQTITDRIIAELEQGTAPWGNRPVYKAQVATFNMAKQLLNMPNGDIATPGNHPILHLRLAKPYRNAYSIALRKQVADAMRLKRKQA